MFPVGDEKLADRGNQSTSGSQQLGEQDGQVTHSC